MKSTSASIILVIILIGGAFVLARGKTGTEIPTLDNVSMVAGKQIIEINAKGGYLPRQTVAKAGLPTTLKVKTNGTFDCSAAIAIPSIGYRKNLSPTAETLIELPPQKVGSTLQGVCAMGMYNFSIKFN